MVQILSTPTNAYPRLSASDEMKSMAARKVNPSRYIHTHSEHGFYSCGWPALQHAVRLAGSPTEANAAEDSDA